MIPNTAATFLVQSEQGSWACAAAVVAAGQTAMYVALAIHVVALRSTTVHITARSASPAGGTLLIFCKLQ